MDLSQRYIGANEIEFSTQPVFERKVRAYEPYVHFDIIENLLTCIDFLPKNDAVQYIGGVTSVGTPVFYVIEYYNEISTIILDFHEIECDEYLDLINESNTIESYGRN
tara:strand:- start:1479 stop:1802 length:324 start_codon:yes stop_codon:yes gene_type:complete